MSRPSQLNPMETRLLGISFQTSTTVINPRAESSTTTTTFSVSNVTIISILGAFAAYATGQLDHLGSFLGSFMRPATEIEVTGTTKSAVEPPREAQTQFLIIFSNFGCKPIDLYDGMKALGEQQWSNDGGKTLLPKPTVQLLDTLNNVQLVQLLDFRAKLPSCDDLTRRTLLMLYKENPKVDIGPLLEQLRATNDGDDTGSTIPQENAWAKGLFRRITTGGPNGSMAGKIAVNFMSTVPITSEPPVFNFNGKASRVDHPFMKILKDAVTSGAAAAAQGLAEYLKTLKPSSSAAVDAEDRETATVVKGIKDSMPATGKTVAQLAVFNALGDPEMAKLGRDEQLRVAYTVANSTRAAVEAVGNHVADLYQTNSIPSDKELEAIGARGLLDFLKSVGSTVATGVLQVAPVVLNAVVNSAAANRALGSTLPPQVTLSGGGLHLLDTPTKIVLAARVVNGTPNPESSVLADKAVSDLANRQSTLGSQATLDTFTNTPPPMASWSLEDPPQEMRNKFRDIALAVADISPTFSNVTDIGATNLVSDTTLTHANALRQNTLEMGIRACANMIADHKSAEMLYQVHLYRVKNGLEVQPRGFLDFLKTAVPIAANIAQTAAPALLAML